MSGHDYGMPAGYLVTICTRNRQPLFGRIIDGIMHLNDFGRIADTHWKMLPEHFPYVGLDKHVVMPDHIHGMIDIIERETQDKPGMAGPWLATATNTQIPERPWQATALRDSNEHDPPVTVNRIIPRPETGSLGAIIGAYKSGVTREINRLRNFPGSTIWQYRYHDRIIRTDASRERVRRYIENNPIRWQGDGR